MIILGQWNEGIIKQVAATMLPWHASCFDRARMVVLIKNNFPMDDAWTDHMIR